MDDVEDHGGSRDWPHRLDRGCGGRYGDVEHHVSLHVGANGANELVDKLWEEACMSLVYQGSLANVKASNCIYCELL
jgi:hypothetical protein